MEPNQSPYNPYGDEPKPPEIHNPLAVMQPGEEVICEVRRHPIGLIGIYLTSALLVAIALGGAILTPYYLTDLSQDIKLAIVLGAGLITGALLLYAYVATIIYNGNRWIVTSDSITQVTQSGLLNRRISQLSLANLEDVTVEQDGLLQSIFGFGLLRAETAGERSKFMFPFCPNPNEYARKIIAAHETYIADRPGETYTANRALANTKSLNQPPSALPPYNLPGNQN